MSAPEGKSDDLLARYRAVRAFTVSLTEGLEVEDMVVQTMEDVSPTKWHLAHTTWFFETFLLGRERPEAPPFDPAFGYLFNSYYQTVGSPYPRPRRGLLSRPTVATVRRYRAHVDEAVEAILADRATAARPEVRTVVEIGLHHEQQHQELLLTDIKHVLGSSPLSPAFRAPPPETNEPLAPVTWHAFDGGIHRIGHGAAGFAFDNERPRHAVFLEPFELSSRLVTAGEIVGFIEEGGYETSELWLAEGFDLVQRGLIGPLPLYWKRDGAQLLEYTPGGLCEIDPDTPACHLSYFEADAYARFAGARLPTEAEWEVAAESAPIEGNFVDTGRLHPAPATGTGLAQLFGDTWEWTQSPYAPYPGYRPLPGSLGEYNGKFMVNQQVLRGGSCFSPRDHLRVTYRNFFPAKARWQMTGARLARDA